MVLFNGTTEMTTYQANRKIDANVNLTLKQIKARLAAIRAR